MNAAVDVREAEAAPGPPAPSPRTGLGRWDVGAMAALFVLGFVPRILWRAGVPTEWDSVQFVLGVTHFDVEQGRPHPPGYYLLIVSARLVRLVTGLGPHGALLLIAATGSALTAAVGYLLGRALRGPWMGLALGLFFATSPFLSFYGSIANSYSVECLGATVLALLAVTAHRGSRHHIWAALALAAVAGFRPSAFVLVAPLALIAVLRSRRDWRSLAVAGGVLVVASAAWAIPEIVEQPGGLEPILRTNRDLWNQASERTSILHGAPADAWFKNIGIGSVHTFLAVAVLLLTALVAFGAFLAAGRRPRWRRPSGQIAILAVGVLPGFLVATFVHFGKQGYVLTFLPSLAAMILCLVDWDRRSVAATALAVVAVTGVYELHVFASNDGLVGPWVVDHVPILGRHDLGAPYNMTRATLKTVDRDARSYLALREVLDPSRDAIVCEGDEGAIRFRQLGYELPEFVIHMVNPGKDVIRMHDNTWAVEGDAVLEVLPGGRAVFTFNAPPPEVLALQQQGLATPIRLSTGPTAWAVPAGVTVFGVSIQENPNAART